MGNQMPHFSDAEVPAPESRRRRDGAGKSRSGGKPKAKGKDASDGKSKSFWERTCMPDLSFCMTGDGKYGCFGGMGLGVSLPSFMDPTAEPEVDEFKQQQETLEGQEKAAEALDETIAARPKMKKIDKPRRYSVPPESAMSAPTGETKVYPKSAESEVTIQTTLDNHFLFKNLDKTYKRLTVDSMERVEYPARESIIKQGEEGNYFYLLESGTCFITVNTKYVGDYGPGATFGDLALMYSAPRAATITTLTHCVLFRLARAEFRSALVSSRQHDPMVLTEFLRDVPLFRSLDKDVRHPIAQTLQPRNFGAGEYIVHQGEVGRCLYIVMEGECFATKYRAGRKDSEITVPMAPYGVGCVFGEGSLLTGHARVANVVARTPLTCLLMDQDSFLKTVAPKLPNLQLNYVLSILKMVPLFSSLADKELYEVISTMEERTYRKGEKIFQQGDKSDTMFVIMAGCVQIKMNLPKGSMQHFDAEEEAYVIAEYLVGEFFGEGALAADDSNRRTTAVAKTDLVRCYLFSCTSMTQLLSVVKAIKQHREEEDDKRARRSKFSGAGFVILNTLGDSERAKVKLVRHKGTGKKCCLKYVKKFALAKNHSFPNLLHERNMFYKYRHPNILTLMGTFTEPAYLGMVFELMEGGSVYGFMLQSPQGKLSNEVAKYFVANVVLALEFLHSHNVVYRDLRPETLLINAFGYVKLSNMNAAVVNASSTTIMFPLVGIAEYTSPEMILGTGYTRKHDLWQLGILIFELLSGTTPFNFRDQHGRNAVKIFQAISLGREGYEYAGPAFGIHDLARNIIDSLLVLRPDGRLGGSDDPSEPKGWPSIRAHKWFSGIDWQKMYAGEMDMQYIPRLTHDVDINNFVSYGEYKESTWNSDEQFEGW